MKILSACASVLLFLAPTVRAAEPQLVEGIVVRVNDRILTTSDIAVRLRERAAEQGAPVPEAMIPQVIQEAADELVLLERAAELKLEVDDREVDQSLERLKTDNHLADNAALEAMVKRLGLSMTQLRTRLRDSALINRVLTKELGAFDITEEELRQRYERDKAQYMEPEKVHLEHIVYTLPGDSAGDDAVMERARRLVAAARAGSDFLTLVAAEVKAGGASGGDLGTLALPDLREEVRTAAEKLADGQVSDPFTSPAGVHVIRVVSHTAATPKPFESVKEELRNAEMAQRYHQRLAGVVDQLKKRYVVEVRPDLYVDRTS